MKNVYWSTVMEFLSGVFLIGVHFLIPSLVLFSSCPTHHLHAFSNNYFEKTKVGSWIEIEKLFVDDEKHKKVVISKISRVIPPLKKQRNMICIEIVMQKYHLSSQGKREKAGHPYILKILYEQAYYTTEFFNIELNPLQGAKEIIFKNGDEDPIWVNSQNHDLLSKIIDLVPSFQYELNKNEFITAPGGAFFCQKYIHLSNATQVSSSPKTSSLWVSTMVPFGLVRRDSRWEKEGKMYYCEEQLLNYGYRNSYSQIKWANKHVPFQALNQLFHRK